MADDRRTWEHRKGDRYLLITASVMGGANNDMRIEHYLDGRQFTTITEAKKAGLRDLHRSDDFNIGVLRGGELVASLWMNEIVDDDPIEMADLAIELGIGVRSA